MRYALVRCVMKALGGGVPGNSSYIGGASLPYLAAPLPYDMLLHARRHAYAVALYGGACRRGGAENHSTASVILRRVSSPGANLSGMKRLAHENHTTPL